jgi:hypothetical protein
VALLLRHGADSSIKNSEGRLAITLSRDATVLQAFQARAANPLFPGQ